MDKVQELIDSKETLIQPRLYKITHYFEEDSSKDALFIETRVNTFPLLLVLVAIQFKFEEIIDSHGDIRSQDLGNLLEKYYEIENVTATYQEYIHQTQIDKEYWDITNTLTIYLKESGETKKMQLVQIDLYQAREFCCGELYPAIIKNALPPTTDFEKDLLELKRFYS